MKAMGAGDIKLMTALGALTGDRTVIYIALFTAIAGGCIVFSYRIYKGGLLRTLNRTKDLLIYYLFFVLEKFSGLPTMTLRKEKYRVDLSDKKRDYIPYALAIGSGVLVTMALSQLGVIVGLSI